MSEIIEYLIGGDMNWRMRFVWGGGLHRACGSIHRSGVVFLYRADRAD